MMNKIKALFLGILFVALSVFLYGCSQENKNYEEYTPVMGSKFICVESYEDPYLGAVKILVDRETRIMYIRYHDSYGDGQYSGMTVLYGSDGKPKKYSGVITD